MVHRWNNNRRRLHLSFTTNWPIISFVTLRSNPSFWEVCATWTHFGRRDLSRYDIDCRCNQYWSTVVGKFICFMHWSTLQNICRQITDQKGDPALKAIRYNKEKTLNWLAYKCKQLQDALRQRKLNLDSGAKSSTFVVSSKINDQQDGKNMRCLYGLHSHNESGIGES